jgi:hypothetical protein
MSARLPKRQASDPAPPRLERPSHKTADKQERSRGAGFRVRVIVTTRAHDPEKVVTVFGSDHAQLNSQKPRRHPNLRQINPGSGGPDQSRSGAARTERTKERKEAERRKAQFLKPPRLRAARTLQGAHAFRRSTAVLAKGSFLARGSAQAMFPKTWSERPVL